jgi:hypothetical protein
MACSDTWTKSAYWNSDPVWLRILLRQPILVQVPPRSRKFTNAVRTAMSWCRLARIHNFTPQLSY